MTTPIDRREAVLRVTALLGGVALVGGSGLLTSCSDADRQAAQQQGVSGDPGFTPEEIALLDEIADTILPDTERSPGAKAARTGAYMAIMVKDTYTPTDQRVFRDGMAQVDARSMKLNGVSFMRATSAQRLTLVQELDGEQFDYMRTRKSGEPTHWFRMMKELSLSGYFTSEIGYTRAMRYIEVPGRYDPCVPYEAGDRAWAAHA